MTHGNYGYAGNHRETSMASSGMGIQASNQCGGFLAITGKAGESKYVQAGSIFCFKTDQGFWVQAVGSDVDLEYTLEPWSLACSPSANKAGLVHWCSKLSVKANTIEQSSILASAMKVTFKEDGIFYMYAR